MMGDFYGAFTTDAATGRESFDPARSFDSMNNADPEEMRQILASIADEERRVQEALGQNTPGSTGENVTVDVDPGSLEVLTGTRRTQTSRVEDENGNVISTTNSNLSFLELAQKNSSHFSSADESGSEHAANNNMGAYNAFHQMSLQAAQQAAALPPGPEREAAEQRALAMQASGQHFLTDRFSSGHQFDKGQMIENNRDNVGGETMANIKAKIFHEEAAHNPNGQTVSNAAGESWQTFDDQQWANRENAENRERVARATTASYGDLNAVLSGQRTADDVMAQGSSARQHMPVFDAANNERVQREAMEMSELEALTHEDIVENIPGTLYGAGARLWGQGKNFAEDVWNANKLFARDVADTVGQGASDAWDWTKETAGDAADTVGQGASDAWDWTKETAGDVADTVGQGASDAWDWTTNTAADVADTASQGASDAWDWTTNTASDVADTVSQDAGAAWDWTKNTASDAVDTVSQGASDAVDWTADTAGAVADTVSQGASDAWDAVASVLPSLPSLW
jgi:hypothetical protein